ncbi:MAG: carboxymuconolactone decarboxylase family protein [Bacillota bacterium]|nr:carboxymuconolactone decarboxylase family protein [Bacillota bacterium]
MNAFIKPPKKIPLFLKLGIIISRRITGKDLLVPKLLAWYPKVAISSGILESLVAHGKKDLNERILKLVRIQVSLSVSCAFCIDMNSFGYERYGITKQELDVLSGRISIDKVATFSPKERIAIEYAKCLCETPIKLKRGVIDNLTNTFTEREIVILASTIAQVNYWARLIHGLGVPPEGFSDKCEL